MRRINNLLFSASVAVVAIAASTEASAEKRGNKPARPLVKSFGAPPTSHDAGGKLKLRQSPHGSANTHPSAGQAGGRKAMLARLTAGLPMNPLQVAAATATLSDVEAALAVVYAVMYADNDGLVPTTAYLAKAADAVTSQRVAPLRHDWQGSFSNKLVPGWDASSMVSAREVASVEPTGLDLRRIMTLGMLSSPDRRLVLETLLADTSVAGDVHVGDLVSATVRFTGPELAAMTMKAKLVASRRGALAPTLEHFAIAHTQVQHERMALGGKAATRAPLGWQGGFAGGLTSPWNASQMAGAPAPKK